MTLIEYAIVVAIVGILGALALFGVQRALTYEDRKQAFVEECTQSGFTEFECKLAFKIEEMPSRGRSNP